MQVICPLPDSRRQSTDREESLLGKMSDRKFARRFRRALSAVKRRRSRLGIRVFNARGHRWTPLDDKLLGVRTDEEIAALLRTTVAAVAHRRRQLRIPACAKQLAQGHFAPSPTGRIRRAGGHSGLYTPEEDKLMGTMPNRQLAKRLGRTRIAVQARRIHLGIPILNPISHVWTPAEDALLGTATDTEIAARLGRKIEVVCMRRQKLGIPNLYWQRRCGRQRRRDTAP